MISRIKRLPLGPTSRLIFAILLISSFQILTSPVPTSAAFIGVSQTGPSSPLSNGLVGYWTFDGKDVVNGVVLDKSGSGNNGNTVAISTSTFYTQGKIGQAGKFDGADDCVNAGTGSNMNLTGAFSVGSWINVGAVQEDRYESIVNKGLWRYYLGIDNNRKVEVWINNAVSLVGATALTADKWHHVVWVHSTSPDEDKIYVDGTTAVYGAVGNLVDPSSDPTAVMAIGTYGCGASNRFKGSIDDVRVYNRALSAQEVQALYKLGSAKIATSQNVAAAASSVGSGLPNLSTGLVGYWTFDGKDVVNGVIQDKSGSGNNGNVATISTSTFYTQGKIGQAGKFDGADDCVNVGSGSSLNLAEAFSVGSWINIDATQVDQLEFIVGKGLLWAYYLNNRKAVVWVSGSISIESANALIPGKWYHFVWVHSTSPDQDKVYINGTTDTYGVVGNLANPPTDSSAVAIGTYSCGTSSRFKGSIDDVRIYNRALSVQEVQELYSMGAGTKMGTSRSLATSTTSMNSGLTNLTTGLVGYWTFDGKDTNWTSATAATTLDKSGNNNTATLYSMKRTTAPVPGKVGQALNFDGVDALVEIPSSASLNSILTNHKLTYDAWVYYRGGSGRDIIGFRGYNPHWGYVLRITDGQPYITFQDAAGSFHTVGSGAYNIPTNKWFHLAMTYDAAASQLIFYVNGVPRTVSENSTTDAMDSVFRMGLSGWSNYDGKLDNVHIYNRVLSAQEILQLYNMGR